MTFSKLVLHYCTREPYRIFLTGFILFYSLFTCLLYSNREWIKRNFLSLTIIFFSTKTGWYSIVVVKSLRKSHWITFDLSQDEPTLHDGKKVRCKNKVYLKSNIEQKNRRFIYSVEIRAPMTNPKRALLRLAGCRLLDSAAKNECVHARSDLVFHFHRLPFL